MKDAWIFFFITTSIGLFIVIHENYQLSEKQINPSEEFFSHEDPLTIHSLEMKIREMEEVVQKFTKNLENRRHLVSKLYSQVDNLKS
jgi:hypothetical protein